MTNLSSLTRATIVNYTSSSEYSSSFAVHHCIDGRADSATCSSILAGQRNTSRDNTRHWMAFMVEPDAVVGFGV